MDAQAGRFNVYNLLDTCGRDSASGSALEMGALRARQRAGGAGEHVGFAASHRAHPRLDAPPPRAARRASAVDAATGADAPWDGPSYPCGNDAALDAFLGDADVMAALHVSDEKAGMRYASTQGDLQPLYRELARKYRLVIFSGDVDMCVPFTFSSSWTEALNFTVADDWHAWTSAALKDDTAEVVAGYAIRYETAAAGDDTHPFFFVTVKGAGHMVPQYEPVFALTLLENFLAFDF